MGGVKLNVKGQICGLSFQSEYSYSDILWSVMCLQKKICYCVFKFQTTFKEKILTND